MWTPQDHEDSDTLFIAPEDNLENKAISVTAHKTKRVEHLRKQITLFTKLDSLWQNFMSYFCCCIETILSGF